MKITIIGTGYVGLDVDPAKIRLLEEGHIPIFEPELGGVKRPNGNDVFPICIGISSITSSNKWQTATTLLT